MAVSAKELRRALDELIATLDRRLPRIDGVGESAIARDAGALRARAVTRLGQLAESPSVVPPAAGSVATPVVCGSISPTPFPTRPSDVAALTASEFAGALDLHASVSIDDVCQRFVDDANRALVWLIRFRALTAWCERTDTRPWLRAEPVRAERACAMAAGFVLNDNWEFDAGEFRSAVQSVAS
jgi:hypothetical protein